LAQQRLFLSAGIAWPADSNNLSGKLHFHVSIMLWPMDD